MSILQKMPFVTSLVSHNVGNDVGVMNHARGYDNTIVHC
jgi:hypothetical protein